MISPTLAAALRGQREDLNARFRAQASVHPKLDADKVLQFVADCVDPVILAVAHHDAERVDTVLSTAYDSALQLLTQPAMDSPEKRSLIQQAWREVLTAAAKHVAQEPQQLIASINNALLHIAATSTRAASQWKDAMARIAPLCANAHDLLQAGQVLAWQCGLAHYRSGALDALGTLAPQLSTEILQCEATTPAAVLQRLREDPWYNPSRPSSVELRIVMRVGAFRGFGGSFIEPPLVAPAIDGWIVRSAAESWYLIADAFGHSFHRASDEEWREAEKAGARNRVEYAGTRLMRARQAIDIQDAGPITSAAVCGKAIACTNAHSHKVVILA